MERQANLGSGRGGKLGPHQGDGACYERRGDTGSAKRQRLAVRPKTGHALTLRPQTA